MGFVAGTHHMSTNNASHVSGVVITFNEAGNIRRCLESLKICDEVLVVDSGSDDETCEIARSMGARVVHQDWLGFGLQKKYAVNQAKHDWVLCLDADEWVSDALSRSIQQLLESPPAHYAYRFPRRNILLGRALRFGGGYPGFGGGYPGYGGGYPGYGGGYLSGGGYGFSTSPYGGGYDYQNQPPMDMGPGAAPEPPPAAQPGMAPAEQPGRAPAYR